MGRCSERVAAEREAILEAARKRGAYNVRIFGSVARGEDGPASDVDFLIDLEEPRNMLDVGGLLMDLERILGCKVHVVLESALYRPIREEVLAEAQPL